MGVEASSTGRNQTAHVGGAGPGLFFFAAVVVLTMLAVESFDPRLIWDATSSKEVRYA